VAGVINIDFDELDWDDDQCAVTGDGPFTGRAVEYNSRRQVVGVYGYRDGLKDGEERRLTPDGVLLYEGVWANGRGVGVHRAWYANGQLKEERTYDERGFLGQVSRWAPDGVAIR
jgi:antitoxin component YwqK of YwqJK toxin-antitoxin module